MSHYVTSATFGSVTVGIEWLESTSLREPGLMRSYYVEIPTDVIEFADEAAEALRAVQKLLTKSLEVWKDAPTLVPDGHVAEVEEEASPYDNPADCGCPSWEGVHEPDCVVEV